MPALEDAGRPGVRVILIDPDGRILLERVPPAADGPWSLPGGAVDGFEPRAAALAAFEAATGVVLKRLRFFATLSPGQSGGDAPSAQLHLFFADDRVPEDELRRSGTAVFRYWPPADLPDLPLAPVAREILDAFLPTDSYRGTVLLAQPGRAGVGVIEIDRWGRVLLQLRDADLPEDRYPDAWSLPGGILEAGEAPDAGALREFEEETGCLLENLKLYRVYRRDPDLPTSMTEVFHIYYIDADLDEDLLEVNEGQALRYFAPAELPGLHIPVHTRRILDDFLVSPAYKAMFH